MDSNTENNKYSFPRRCQPKEYTTWSPRNKGLPNIASSIEFPSKVQVNLPSNSPSGALLRGSKTNKAAASVRLIPLSLETRGKENLGGTRKVSSFKLGLEATDKFEPSHVAVIMHDRPISEEFAKEAASDKLTQKVTVKPFYNWLEKSFKLPTVTSPPSLCNNVPGDVSTKSKFKSKLLTARVTEEDIAKQLTKTRNSECTPKEVPLNELAQNSSQKKSGLSRYGSMTLAKAMPEVSSWQEHVNNKPSVFSKGMDSLNERKIEQLNGREAAMVEPILLSASKSPKNMPNFQAIQAIKDKDTPQKVSSSVSPQMTTMKMPGQSQENGQFQPRKLFQRKDAQTTVRSPLLFARKPANESTKPSTFSGQNTLTKVELPTPTLEEANGVIQVPLEKSKSHNNNNVNNNGEYAKQQQLTTTLPASRKSLLRKEYFHGEIRGNILKWKMGDFIGAGNFGQVYRAMEVESGKIIAVKTIASTNLVNKELLISLESELNILQKLQHKHIVQYIGHENIDNSLYIYLEYMSGGNITNIITKYGALPEKTVKVYAKQILAGLIYLHENKVIHKDIKGANILVDGDGTVKLADFGCSSQLEKTISNFDTFLANSLKGSIPWMAPEVVKETGYGRRSDIWSFGCTILEMATGKVPWSHYQFENPVAVLMKIALSEEIPLIPDSLSDELKSFLRLCLQRDPKKRPHAQDLINHPFLKN